MSNICGNQRAQLGKFSLYQLFNCCNCAFITHTNTLTYTLTAHQFVISCEILLAKCFQLFFVFEKNTRFKSHRKRVGNARVNCPLATDNSNSWLPTERAKLCAARVNDRSTVIRSLSMFVDHVRYATTAAATTTTVITVFVCSNSCWRGCVFVAVSELVCACCCSCCCCYLLLLCC